MPDDNENEIVPDGPGITEDERRVWVAAATANCRIEDQ